MPVVAMLRREYGSALWENFEYLAVLAKNFARRRPAAQRTTLLQMLLALGV